MNAHPTLIDLVSGRNVIQQRGRSIMWPQKLFDVIRSTRSFEASTQSAHNNDLVNAHTAAS